MGLLSISSGGGSNLGDSVETAEIADDAVSLAKMAHGTAGNLITYSAAGAPAAVATGTATHVLTSNGAGAAPTFQVSATGVGGSTGATDNAILRADGTGGATAQGSAVTIDDAGVILFPAALDGSPAIRFNAADANGSAIRKKTGSTEIQFVNGLNNSFVRTQANEAQASSFYFGDSGPVFYNSGGNIIGLFQTTAFDPAFLRVGRVVVANTAGVGAPSTLNKYESFSINTNEGAGAENYRTLPTAVAGYQFTFIVQDGDGLRITAAAADTIRPGTVAASAAAGYIRCATQGASITLVAINQTEWVATSMIGTWTVDS